MLLELNILYIDSKEEDAAAFKERIMNFDGLDGFLLKFTHRKSINSGLQWLSLNKGGDIIVCFDPTSKGIGEQNLGKAINLLKTAAESDRVFALPSSASSEVIWRRIKEVLPSDQIVKKSDVYNDGGMSILVQSAIASMSSRNSDGRRQTAIEMAQLSGEQKVRDSELRSLLALSKVEISALSKEVDYLKARMNTIDDTVFSNHPGSQVLPLVEQVRSNQRGLAGVMKGAEKLDQDIHSAVTLLNGRTAELQDSLVNMIESINTRIDGFVDKQSEQKTQIKISRETHVFKILTVVLTVLLGAGLSTLAGILRLNSSEIAEFIKTIGDLLN